MPSSNRRNSFMGSVMSSLFSSKPSNYNLDTEDENKENNTSETSNFIERLTEELVKMEVKKNNKVADHVESGIYKIMEEYKNQKVDKNVKISRGPIKEIFTSSISLANAQSTSAVKKYITDLEKKVADGENKKLAVYNSRYRPVALHSVYIDMLITNIIDIESQNKDKLDVTSSKDLLEKIITLMAEAVSDSKNQDTAILEQHPNLFPIFTEELKSDSPVDGKGTVYCSEKDEVMKLIEEKFSKLLPQTEELNNKKETNRRNNSALMNTGLLLSSDKPSITESKEQAIQKGLCINSTQGIIVNKNNNDITLTSSANKA